MSGDCAHTSQSAVDRRNWIGCRSEGTMGDSAANSLNKRCVGMSPGTLSSPVTRTYRAGSIYLFKKNKKSASGDIEGQSFYVFSVTWQSRLQRGGPDSMPWCTLGDSSLGLKLQLLHKHAL